MPSDAGELRADCARCAGLCCVALPFARSADFAIDKPAGMPCPHLELDHRCEIHGSLRTEGFGGCVAYDCFGAGQQTTQVTFGGRSWSEAEVDATAMFEAFRVLQPVHEMRWYLADAARRELPSQLRAQVTEQVHRLQQLSNASPTTLRALDSRAERSLIGELLHRVSRSVRGEGEQWPGRELAGRDLAGRNLRSGNLRNADLRGALMIAADLDGADLRTADLLGADLRDANLVGADLSDVLFLTAPQLAAARGSRTTRIPAWLDRPGHWA